MAPLVSPVAALSGRCRMRRSSSGRSGRRSCGLLVADVQMSQPTLGRCLDSVLRRWARANSPFRVSTSTPVAVREPHVAMCAGSACTCSFVALVEIGYRDHVALDADRTEEFRHGLVRAWAGVVPISTEQPDRVAAQRAGRSHDVQPAGHTASFAEAPCGDAATGPRLPPGQPRANSLLGPPSRSPLNPMRNVSVRGDAWAGTETASRNRLASANGFTDQLLLRAPRHLALVLRMGVFHDHLLFEPRP